MTQRDYTKESSNEIKATILDNYQNYSRQEMRQMLNALKEAVNREAIYSINIAINSIQNNK